MSTAKPLTKTLLQILTVAGKGAIDFYNLAYDLKFNGSAYLHGGHTYVRQLKRLQNEREAKLVLKRLRQRGYIKAEKLGRRLLVTLTTKGRQATLATQLQNAPMLSGGWFTVVIFDVPQSVNNARRQLRWLLRQGDFIKLQQSVWISRADAYKPLTELCQRLKLQPWVNVFYARNFLHLPHQVIK
ncbi:MAG: hypothetical protein V1712_03400 [Patescibacteria group bacterium]